MKTLSAWYRGKRVEVPVDDVTHFTAGDKYVTAHHKGGELILSTSLTRLESQLPDFIRIHRGSLVRRSCIINARGFWDAGRHWCAMVTFQNAPMVVGTTYGEKVVSWLNERGAA